MLSYAIHAFALHAMNDQTVAIYFINPCLRRRITRILYASTRRAWTSFNILLQWCIFQGGTAPLAKFSGGLWPLSPPPPLPVPTPVLNVSQVKL